MHCSEPMNLNRKTNVPSLRSCRPLLWLFALAFSSLIASAAVADDAPDARSGRKFFARGALGAGWVELHQDSGSNKTRLGGVGAYWDLAVGVTVWKGLSVHGSYFGGYTWDPKTTIGGREQTSDDRTSLAILGFGPGVTYTFDPINLYVSYGVGFGWSVLQFHHNTAAGEPAGWRNTGFANQIVIGKEWLIQDGFSVGLGVQTLYARVVDDSGGSDVNYNSFGGSALFSSTYR